MDIKKLYLNTQKNLLNWVVVATAFLLVSAAYSLFFKFSARKVSLWITFALYFSIFIISCYNRIKIKLNLARAAFYLYMLFSVYYLIEMMIKFKANYAQMQSIQPYGNSIMLLFFSYGMGILFLVGLNYLLYRGSRATQNIIELNSKP